MTKKISTIIVGMMTAVLLIPTMSMVYAEVGPYLGNVGPQGQTGSYTLEEALAIQKGRVDAARDNPASGSGTPYLDVNGVVGASIIASAVFGGMAGTFFVRGRAGKYAAMGRG